MNFKAMPKLRMEIEGMKHGIISHLGAMDSELGEALSAEITKVVESYPWEEQVAKIVHDAISEEIKRYFKDGDGKEAVKSAIDEGFKAVLG